jgi:plasmid stability protein
MVCDMPKMIQIRNVPDDVHRRLRMRAAEAGMSLSDYLLQEVTEVAGSLTTREVVERAGHRGPLRLTASPEELVRQERDANG